MGRYLINAKTLHANSTTNSPKKKSIYETMMDPRILLGHAGVAQNHIGCNGKVIARMYEGVLKTVADR